MQCYAAIRDDEIHHLEAGYTRRKDGRERETMFLDMKKAHLAPLCEKDVWKMTGAAS